MSDVMPMQSSHSSRIRPLLGKPLRTTTHHIRKSKINKKNRK